MALKPASCDRSATEQHNCKQTNNLDWKWDV